MTYQKLFKTIGLVELTDNATISEQTENKIAYMVYFLVKNNAMPTNFNFNQFGVIQILANLCEKILDK